MKRYYLFIISFFILSFIGIIMIYSASSIWAEYKTGNKYYYLIRQIIFFFIAFFVFIIASKVNYKKWIKLSNPLMIISIILMILVLIPGIGLKRGGARSWIGVGDLSFQPSEILKIALIIFTAKLIKNYNNIFLSGKNVILYMLLLGLVFLLIILEPDLGSGILILGSIIFMMYIGLVKNKYCIIGIISVFILGVLLIMFASYRMKRIEAYIDPWSDPLGSGFQIIQSLYALGPSGLFGYGLFNSRQKYFYLPEPQTDFIFAIIVEELGIIGGLFVLLLFLNLIYIGFKSAIKCEDVFGMYLLIGLTSLLFIQVFVNIGVVIGLLPVTGVTLPFISYGGSSLIVSFLMMGIIANIIKEECI